jgi:hypothetical protein
MEIGLIIALSVAASATATGVGMYMSYEANRQQTEAQQAQLNYQAAQAKQQAQAKEAETLYNAAQLRRKQKLWAGQKMAQIGASGVGMTGSPLLEVAEDATQMKMDELNLLRTGQMERDYMETQSQFYKMTSKATGSVGRSVGNSILMSGASNMAGTIASGMMDYSKYNALYGTTKAVPKVKKIETGFDYGNA